MKNFYCILFSFVFGSMLLTETSTASICDQKETIVFYGNGVKALEDDAYDSQNVLKNQLEKYLPPGDKLNGKFGNDGGLCECRFCSRIRL